MPIPKVTVAVPTLAAGDALAECLGSLERQTVADFEVIVVDNSGEGRAGSGKGRERVIANGRNVGFGAAVNQAFRISQAPYLAVLNDDATADRHWLEALLECARRHPGAGMFASQVRMGEVLDSAGMLIAADGSSKQRGHGEPPEAFAEASEALFPSGSAAMYRREMLEQIGGFDESYFLYCEDTDLGLRARWAGWECRYAPEAKVEHRYSHTAGAASWAKAYYVERNRLFTIVKNFPLGGLLRAPFAAGLRYFWHVLLLAEGRGKAWEFQRGGRGAVWLPVLAVGAHGAALRHLPSLLRERRRIMRSRRISARDFKRLLARHAISLRRVAAL
ncbi:MAG TPA: glycosyltransferase family 2 protein [Bryobacteraceae bacterium]|nr:glycosyltransferase family 2 protein [Bryobacteraceae bacterium]